MDRCYWFGWCGCQLRGCIEHFKSQFNKTKLHCPVKASEKGCDQTFVKVGISPLLEVLPQLPPWGFLGRSHCSFLHLLLLRTGFSPSNFIDLLVLLSSPFQPPASRPPSPPSPLPPHGKDRPPAWTTTTQAQWIPAWPPQHHWFLGTADTGYRACPSVMNYVLSISLSKLENAYLMISWVFPEGWFFSVVLREQK